jgi:hypothetical protein
MQVMFTMSSHRNKVLDCAYVPTPSPASALPALHPCVCGLLLRLPLQSDVVRIPSARMCVSCPCAHPPRIIAACCLFGMCLRWLSLERFSTVGCGHVYFWDPSQVDR